MVIPDPTTEAGSYNEVKMFWFAPFTDQNGDGLFTNSDWFASGTPNEQVQLVSGTDSSYTFEIEVPYDDSDTTQNVIAFSAMIIYRNELGSVVNTSQITSRSMLDYNPGADSPPTNGPSNLVAEVIDSESESGWTQELLTPYTAAHTVIGHTGRYTNGGIDEALKWDSTCGHAAARPSADDPNNMPPQNQADINTSNCTYDCMTSFFPKSFRPEDGGIAKTTLTRTWGVFVNNLTKIYSVWPELEYAGTRNFDDLKPVFDILPEGPHAWLTLNGTQHSWVLRREITLGTKYEVWIIYKPSISQYIAYEAKLQDDQDWGGRHEQGPTSVLNFEMRKIDNFDNALDEHNPFGCYVSEFYHGTAHGRVPRVFHFGTNAFDANPTNSTFADPPEITINPDGAEVVSYYVNKFSIPNCKVDGVDCEGIIVDTSHFKTVSQSGNFPLPVNPTHPDRNGTF